MEAKNLFSMKNNDYFVALMRVNFISSNSYYFSEFLHLVSYFYDFQLVNTHYLYEYSLN